MNSDNRDTIRRLAHRARRALALAALFVLTTTAAATWLAGTHAEASATDAPLVRTPGDTDPTARSAVTTPTSPPVARAANEPLMKNGKVLRGKLNINTATGEQLQMLPGIGPKKAQRVIDYRNRRGRFKRVRDLRRVKGFGYKTVSKLAPHLTVEGKSTLRAE